MAAVVAPLRSSVVAKGKGKVRGGAKRVLSLPWLELGCGEKMGR